jgi:hypothetical protein
MNSTQPVTADSQDASSDDPVKDPTYWPFIIVGVVVVLIGITYLDSQLETFGADMTPELASSHGIGQARPNMSL